MLGRARVYGGVGVVAVAAGDGVAVTVGVGNQARVPAQRVLEVGQREGRRRSRHGVGVAVGAVVRALVARSERVAGGEDEREVVDHAVVEVGEVVVPVLVRCRRRKEPADPVVEQHDDAGDPRLARVLDAVAVDVLPHEVADVERADLGGLGRRVVREVRDPPRERR